MNTLLGQNIKEARIRKGISQSELGMNLGGISRKTVSAWETDKNYPEFDTIIDICNLLDLSLDAITGLKNGIDGRGISPDEFSIIRAYRNIDDIGKGAVKSILEYEVNRCLK